MSGFAFIGYGYLCLCTDHMKIEFQRYGLNQYRRITGVFELLGGIGSLVGLGVPVIHQISTLGLCVLMLLGLTVRIKIKDPFLALLPAILLACVNAYLFLQI